MENQPESQLQSQPENPLPPPKEVKRCQICGKATGLNQAIILRPVLAALIEKTIGKFDPVGWICSADLNTFRHKYVESIMEDERGEITSLEKEVIDSLQEQELISKNPEEEDREHSTVGQKLADKISAFGGSWTFIIIFMSIILVWIALNSIALFRKQYDPYPYILLNLVLSCLAALQAPVIMMSQKRQEDRDRQRGVNDYQVNLKAELEIRHLHQKMDHLLTNQWARLVEIQNVQMELMNEIRDKKRRA